MTVDIHLQIIDPSAQTFGETLTFDLANVILVSGPQAVANQWLKTFLTPKGTDPVYKESGTEFAYLMGSNINDQLSLQALLSEYVEDAAEQRRAIDRQNLSKPSSSRLRSAEIIQYTAIDSTRAEFWVQIFTQSGERVLVLIPYKASQ